MKDFVVLEELADALDVKSNELIHLANKQHLPFDWNGADYTISEDGLPAWKLAIEEHLQ
jgi:hypothetical protein